MAGKGATSGHSGTPWWRAEPDAWADISTLAARGRVLLRARAKVGERVLRQIAAACSPEMDTREYELATGIAALVGDGRGGVDETKCARFNSDLHVLWDRWLALDADRFVNRVVCEEGEDR